MPNSVPVGERLRRLCRLEPRPTTDAEILRAADAIISKAEAELQGEVETRRAMLPAARLMTWRVETRAWPFGLAFQDLGEAVTAMGKEYGELTSDAEFLRKNFRPPARR